MALFKIFDTPTTTVSFGGTKGAKGDSAYTPVDITDTGTKTLTNTDIGQTWFIKSTSQLDIELPAAVDNGFQLTLVYRTDEVVTVFGTASVETVNLVLGGNQTLQSRNKFTIITKQDDEWDVAGNIFNT